jgi:thymidylate kinase
MFWDDPRSEGEIAANKMDLKVYTYILYLDVPAHIITERRRNNKERRRPDLKANNLEKWKEIEKDTLRTLCRENNILFCAL